MYTLREFRANTKQAFDDAVEGHEVVIKRDSQMFQLIALVKEPLAGHSFESVPKSKPKLLEKIKSDWKPCKHGADPKFCRFAKSGSPCK